MPDISRPHPRHLISAAVPPRANYIESVLYNDAMDSYTGPAGEVRTKSSIDALYNTDWYQCIGTAAQSITLTPTGASASAVYYWYLPGHPIDIRGHHFMVRLYIHEGAVGVTSYTNITDIRLWLKDSTGPTIGSYVLTQTADTYLFPGQYEISGTLNDINTSDINWASIDYIGIQISMPTTGKTPSVSVDEILLFKPAAKTGLVAFFLDGAYSRQLQACAYLEGRKLASGQQMRAFISNSAQWTGDATHLDLATLQRLQYAGHTIGPYICNTPYDGAWDTLTDAEIVAAFAREQNYLVANQLGNGARIASQAGTSNVTPSQFRSLLPKVCDALLGGYCPRGSKWNQALWNGNGAWVLGTSFFQADAAAFLTTRIAHAKLDNSLLIYGAHLQTNDQLTQFYLDVDEIVTACDAGGLTPVTIHDLISGEAVRKTWKGSIAGTANQITVSSNSKSVPETITLSGPQDLHTAASPTFAGLTLGTMGGLLKGTAGVVSAAIADPVAPATNQVLTAAVTTGALSWAQPAWGDLANIPFAAADGATKGICAFSAVNFTAAVGVVTTVQNIATTSVPQFAGLLVPYVYPASDSTTAFQIRKANASTVVVNVDTTSGLVGIGKTNPSQTLDVVGAVYASTYLRSPTVYPVTDATQFLGKNSITAPLAWSGVCMKDTTNGNYYRLQITNGAVALTQIT